MIEAEGVTLKIGKQLVLDDVSLRVEDGSSVALLGPNGSGKTTLLRCLFGSLTPDAGTVTIDGTPIDQLSRKEFAHRISVVAQQNASDLPVSVAELVMLGRLPHLGLTGKPTAEDEQIVADSLDHMGALPMATRDFSQLSGGEKQRVLIARGLAQRASHLLLDEPTNHLDIRYQHEVVGLATELPIASLLVLHDLNLAARYCDEIYLLNHGKIIAHGPTSDVLRPEILEPVYHLPIQRYDTDDGFTLVFARPTPDFEEKLRHEHPSKA